MKDIDELLRIAIKEQYKELCDKIKMQILEKLEEVTVMKEKDKQYITFYELAYMRQQLNKIRSKEHEREMRAIGGVISMILDRTEEPLPSHNSKSPDKKGVENENNNN